MLRTPIASRKQRVRSRTGCPNRGLIVRLVCGFFVGLSASLLDAMAASAAPGTLPSHQQSHAVDSGSHSGRGRETEVAFTTLVEFPDAPWLRVYFDDCDLGEASYLTITSRLDGSSQRLDAVSLVQYGRASVYFNGDAVEVALHVAPQDEHVYFRLGEVAVGEKVGAADGSKHLCGGDDRVPSSRSSVGRILENLGSDPGTGTAWIAANGALVTCGHNVTKGIMNVLQFNVPQSTVTGIPQHPPASDQYSIIVPDSDHYHDDTDEPDFPVGDDWAVFTVQPNSNTGLLPLEAQGVFIRVSRDLAPDAVRVTGYGMATTSTYTSRTQQTDTGPFLAETFEGPSDVSIAYEVDTTGGVSGGPVEDTLYYYAVGVHTDGGCYIEGRGNRGCSIENDSFEQVLNNGFIGTPVMYADINHACPYEDGTLSRPYDSVIEAAAASAAGGTVYIIGGSYNETGIIDEPVTLTASPVAGTVIIGQ